MPEKQHQLRSATNCGVVGMRRILVADDEANMRWVLQRALSKAGYEVEAVPDGETAIASARAERPDLALLDWKMPGLDGLGTLRELKTQFPDLTVIILTAHGTTAHAVEAMKAGAYDYITKPFDVGELLLTVAKALEMQNLKAQVAYLRGQINEKAGWAQVIGNSAAMRAVYELVARVAPTTATVLLEGESGTGKELVAHAIYSLSERRNGPFIRINCAALPENLIESELFGHEKGAFTGAHERKAGRFELADGGTLFLDEIGELPLPLQAKLLRALQERSFERVGGVKTIQVDVRIIAATNRDLAKEMQAGRFREDLYYRLNVFPIRVPPLRERREDIPLLVQHFLQRTGNYGRNKSVTPAVMERLVNYAWPGNVRELQNVVERMAIISAGQEITLEYLPDFSFPGGKTPHLFTLPAEGISLEEVEQSLLKQAMERTNGNQSQAARLLGLTRHTLLYRLEKYRIDPHWGSSGR